MGNIKIKSDHEEVYQSARLESLPDEGRIYIRPSAMDHTIPEMYNLHGEELYFLEVPREALDYWGALAVVATTGIEKGSEIGRNVLTLAKMEKNIAADGQSFRKVNINDGVRPSSVTEFTATTRGGMIMKLKPQYGQYEFFSNRGLTRLLGISEDTGKYLDIAMVLLWDADDDKKTLIPFPGDLGVLNIPFQQYFNDLDEGLEEMMIQDLQKTKKEGARAVDNLINLPAYKKLNYYGIWISNETMKRIFNHEIKTIDEVQDLPFEGGQRNIYILYREMETKKGRIAVIEAFFFDKIE